MSKIYIFWLARYVGIKPKSIGFHMMRSMSECRVRFENCCRSFLSPTMYKSASTKIIAMYGSVFQCSIHFGNAYTDAFHMLHIIS